MRTWMTFDIDVPLGEPRRLPYVGVDERDNARLELLALAAELSTLVWLACGDLHRLSAAVPSADIHADLAGDCARLKAAAEEVLSDSAKTSDWPHDDLEHAQVLFRHHLADAAVLRARVSALVPKPSKRRRRH